MKSLMNKIKLIWKGRKIATELITIKSRWKKPSFWTAILGQAGSLIGALQGVIDPKVAIVISTVTTALYNYVRGLEKAETDGVSPYKTRSEFLLGITGLANSVFIGLQEQGINPAWMATSSVVIGHAMVAAGELSNMRPKEVIAAHAATSAEIKEVHKEASQ